MKVLHLFDWYLPSTLSWVDRLLGGLTGEWQVQVGAPWIVKGPFLDPHIEYLDFPVQRLLFSPVSEWQHPGWQKLFARSQRFLPLYPEWLYGCLRQSPPHVLHAHFGPTGCLYLPLAQRLNRPLVVTFYGFDYQKILRRRPVFRKKYARLFQQAECVVAASPTGSEALQMLGCPSEKLAIVRPSINLQQFPFLQRNKAPNRLRLVQLATFTPKKGHMTTLEAFRQASKDCPGLHLTLAGEPYDAMLVRQLRTFIQTNGLERSVTWLDAVPHHRIADFLSGFDAFIHPSQTTAEGDHEATPVVLLEAQATGLPVLATRHFDLPDEVENERSGILVPERDTTALAAAIRRFYRMESVEYQEFSRQARLQVLRGFAIEKSVQATSNLYKTILNPTHSKFPQLN